MLPTELQEYLDQHQVERLLKEMLASLLFCKPENPLEFMIKCLSEVKNSQDDIASMNFKDLFMQVGEKSKEKGGDDLFSAFASEGFAPSAQKAIDEDEDAEEDGEISALNRFEKVHIVNKRRGSVSAESFKPTEEEYEKVVIFKSEEAKKRIQTAISNNLLFRNLEIEQRNEIIDAMFEKKVEKGKTVITQGEEGDNFYVVDSGAFDVFVNGKNVVQIQAGGSFGELALMYNTPRAATVTAIEDSVLWATDRVTFRRIVTNNMFRKRKLYESFLMTVPILNTLNPAEVTKIADALEPVEYSDNDEIVRQGDEGDCFYILVDGEAKVTITKDGQPHQMMKYHKGEYFGEIALINNSPRAATVTSVGKSKCVSLNRAAFIRLLGPILEILKRNMEDYKKYEEYEPEN